MVGWLQNDGLDCVGRCHWTSACLEPRLRLVVAVVVFSMGFLLRLLWPPGGDGNLMAQHERILCQLISLSNLHEVHSKKKKAPVTRGVFGPKSDERISGLPQPFLYIAVQAFICIFSQIPPKTCLGNREQPCRVCLYNSGWRAASCWNNTSPPMHTYVDVSLSVQMHTRL